MAAEIALSANLCIEPQFALALALIRPMARIAAVGKNRPDIPIELDSLSLSYSGSAARGRQ